MENKNISGKKIIETIGLVTAVVIFAVIGALIIASVLSDISFTTITASGTNTNETLISVTNLTNSSFAILVAHPNTLCGLTVVQNATGGENLTSGNYTFFTNCNLILNVNGSSYNGTNLNVTYSFSYDTGRNPTGVNTTLIAEQFGLFITGLIAFLAIIGTIVGVIWLVLYVKKLFDKKDGISTMTA